MKATLLIVILALGCGARQVPPLQPPSAAAKPAPPTSAAPAALPDDGVERYAVPAGGPMRGPAGAKVTIVEFSDFQCPFCARATATVERILREYPNDVRIFYRHDPLSFHDRARAAAEAAAAADLEGKFWAMHDTLFANQGRLDDESLARYAKELGVDQAKRAAAAKVLVDTDLALASRLGVRGTPTFFVNGRLLQGAQPFEEFKPVIEAERAHALALLAAGVAPDALYATTVARAKLSLDVPSQTLPSAGAEVYKIEPGDAPRRGGAQPKVTIIEFSDFQCPFCARVEKTLATLLHDYGDDVALVFRHNPLPFHERAMPAALAVEAAREQGKFWEMHDALFEDQEHLDDEGLERHARELGLDGKRFDAARAGAPAKERVARDMAEAVKFGARGTPNFFINGRSLRGAQPLAAFKAVIDAELKAADAKLAAGTPRAKLYEALIEKGTIPPPPPPDEAGPESDETVHEIVAGPAPARGPKDATLEVVLFADFQCPFCKRVEPTLRQLEREYPGQIRLVWKNFPLPFHENAELAAEAVMAADAQGKFWPMYDKLWTVDLLDRGHLEQYAKEVHLDLPRFRADLDARRYHERIEADVAEGQRASVNGTPAVFINGRKIAGAYPWETFKKVADQELAKAVKQQDGKKPDKKTAKKKREKA
jgi:protein-disulfide isomerase